MGSYIIPDCGHYLAQMLEVNTTLEKLNLEQNYLNNIGAIEIANGLKKNKTLRELNLGTNNITSKAAVILIDVLANSNSILEKLILSENDIGLEAIVKL